MGSSKITSEGRSISIMTAFMKAETIYTKQFQLLRIHMTISEARKQFEEAQQLSDSELEELCRLSELLSDIVIDIALKDRSIDKSYESDAN